MPATAIQVDEVSKRFRIYKNRNQSLKGAFLQRGRGTHEDFWALRDVSLEIPEGKTFGLLGHNGSGKSTLLKCIAKILTPDRGSITAHGRMAAMLEVGSGFHPELSGRENIYLNGAILGMSRKEIDSKFDDIVDFSGVAEFIDQPVKNYSSGMYVRLGFSVSIHVEPEILLVDEVLAVGDMEFQERCMGKFADFREQGRTVVVVSHGLEQMRTFCDEAAWLDHGVLQDVGPAAPLVDKYSDVAHGAQELREGGTRFGSGEARIERIEILGPDGLPAKRLSTGDQATIRLHYQADQVVKRPVFGASIDTRDGMFVWGLHGLDAGFQPEEIGPGKGSVDVRIPSLMLRPNTYVISGSIQPPHLTSVIDALQRATAFDIAPGPRMESGGVLALDAQFGNLEPPQQMVAVPVRAAKPVTVEDLSL
ncbi:Teichoic acids export ATP-binding protein TagH [Actinomyces bovis]|uniref:Teichoic acids export ATP-binding protein TagH n=1 Tax=Actinomyces bovis TaxID=1658 RepID=A0ABY1VNP3_9ACTO|nr:MULTISPECIES: ABC transporter ATP-binding protein [Actinomyces]SPT53301.1 Teichoic acids export ATP-binding protein TagH [Actinomyces bovis]VEG52616.1 Teichoic acids export ATP-binding protein TagH [Actinomyces israelii]